MITQRQYHIIKFLLEMKKPISSQMIAQKMGVSQRTIKTEIGLIKEQCEDSAFHIISKKGTGYQIIVIDNESVSSILEKYSIYDEYNVFEERNSMLQCLLIKSNKAIHLQDFEDEMYSNRNSIYQCINHSVQVFLEYDLALKSSNKGYFLYGKEHNKRVFIHNLLKRNYTYVQKAFHNYKGNPKEKKQIIEVVINYLHEEKEKAISKVSVDEIVDYLYLSHIRNREGNVLSFTSNDRNLIREFPITYATSSKIIKELKEKFQMQYTKDDVLFLLILLMSYRLSNISYAKETLRKELYTIANECLHYVQKSLGIQEEDANDTLMNITCYLRSFQLRNYYKIMIRIDYISYVKIRRSFLAALDMAYYCLEYLYHTYGYMINEDELLYLLPCFVTYHNSLKKKHKLNALVITISGVMFGNLIKEKLKDEFEAYFNNIDVKEYYLTTKDDFLGIDIIISDCSTKLLNINNIPICQVSSLMEEPRDITTVMYFLMSMKQMKLVDIFYEENLFYGWEVIDRNEMFHGIVSIIGKFYPCIDKSLLLRELVRKESVISYECGNNVAVCFLYDDIFVKERFLIIVNKQPFLWKREVVQVVFVFCLRKNNFSNYQYLTREICSLIQNFDAVSAIANNVDYHAILKLIQSFGY